MSRTADPLAERLDGMPTWRVLGLAAGCVGASLLTIVLLLVVARMTAPMSPLPPRLHEAVVGLAVVLLCYEVGRRFLLRAPAAWFLAGRPDRTVLPWVAFGFALPTVVIGVQLWLLGATRVGQLPALDVDVRYIIDSVGMGLLSGVLEELAFRGALLRLLEARWGPAWAIGGSAVVFAALHQGHADRPGPLVLVLGTMLAAGLLLGVVVVRTRSVWSAVAVHLGWNAVVGGQLVAVAAPGATVLPAVVQFQLARTSLLLTGGEATLAATPMTMALLLLAAAGVARLRPAHAFGGRPIDPVAGDEPR